MRCHRTDPDHAIRLGNEVKVRNSSKVNEAGRRSQAKLQQRYQTLAACQHFAVRVLAEQLEGLPKAFRVQSNRSWRESRLAPFLNQVPNFLRRHRDVNVLDAQRRQGVDDAVDKGGQRPDGPCFSNPLDSQGIAGCGCLGAVALDPGHVLRLGGWGNP